MYKAFLDNGIVSSIISTLDNKDISVFLNDPNHAKTRSVALVSFCTVIAAYALSRVSRFGSKTSFHQQIQMNLATDTCICM